MRSKSSKEEKKNHPQRGAAASFQATFNGLYLMVYHHISHRMHMPGHKCDHPNLQNCAAKKCKSAYLRKKCLHPSQIGNSIACETVLVLTTEADSLQFFLHKPENVIRGQRNMEKYLPFSINYRVFFGACDLSCQPAAALITHYSKLCSNPYSVTSSSVL